MSLKFSATSLHFLRNRPSDMRLRERKRGEREREGARETETELSVSEFASCGLPRRHTQGFIVVHSLNHFPMRTIA